MPILSIDTAATREAARFVRVAVAPELADVLAQLDRIAHAADLQADAEPVLTLVHDGVEGALAVATMLDVGAGSAESADLWFGLGADVFAAASTVASDVVDFFAGDLLALWNGGREGFPYGQVAAGGLRTWRILKWMRGPAGVAMPVFSNGGAGNVLAKVLERLPATLSAAEWLRSPAAVTTFRRLGIVGAGVSTAVGAYDLWQQGDPVDAFEREGVGYVADVAGTAFSASTMTFLIAPNPVTAGLVVVTGAVWIGAEVWDAWGDDISEWVGDRAVDVADAAGALWDTGSGIVGDVDDTVGGAIGGAWNGIFG